MELVGTSIGSIEIVEKLGSGGMGDVFVGMDHNLGRQVAVKVVRGGENQRKAYRARFANEARILSQLEHAHICRIYDFLEGDDCDFLVMELIRGRDLVDFMKTHPSFADRLKVASQIAEVLIVTHERKIVHRDLKPQNVMVQANEQIKVLDYGIARALSTAESSFEDSGSREQPEYDSNPKPVTGGILTKYGVVVGTPMYMSPEQASGREVTAASDMYSFGLLLQWLFTERPPYVSCSSAELVDRVIRGATVPVLNLDPDLTVLINRLKSMVPDVRPTAVDTATQLEWIRAKPKRRLRRSVVAAFGALLLIGTMVSSLAFLRARKAQQAAIQARLQAEAVNRFIEDMLASADPERKGIDVKVVDILDDAALEAEREFADNPLVRAAITHTLAKTNGAIGRNEQAIDLLQKAVALRLTELGPDHLETLKARQSLAAILTDQGQYQQAREINDDLIARYQAKRDLDHPDYLTAHNLKGWILIQEGKYLEAEPIVRQAVQDRKRVLGERHRDTLASMNSLGACLLQQGRNQDAEDAYIEFIDLSTELNGLDHPLTLNAMMNLASAQMYLGKYREAERLLLETRERMTLVMGPRHPRTIMVMQNLGAVLLFQDKLDEAESALGATIDLGKEVLGEEHPTVLLALQNRMAVDVERGELVRAETHAREIIAIQERLYEPGHPTTFLARMNLANVVRLQKRYDEAERELLRTINLARDQMGPDHPNTIQALFLLAHNYQDQANYPKAVEIFRQVADVRLKELGPDHESTMLAFQALGMALDKSGSPLEALQHLRDTLPRWLKRYGPTHHNSLRATANLADLERELNHLDEAKALYQELAKRRSEVNGLDHDSTLTALNRLAETLLDQHDDESIQIYRTIWERKQARDGEDAEGTLETVHQMAMAQMAFHDAEAAEVSFRHILDVLLDRGVLNMRVIQAYNDLAWMLASEAGPDKWSEAEQLARDGLETLEKMTVDPMYSMASANVMDTLALTLEKQGRLDEARQWYRKSADLGHQPSQDALIRLDSQKQ